MKLKNKIKSIIDALKDSDVNHIEISSFWGAQKIKMIKDVSTNKFTLTQNQSPPAPHLRLVFLYIGPRPSLVTLYLYYTARTIFELV